MLLCATAKLIAHSPAPGMLVQPTLDLAKRFSKQRIAPLIAANPCLRDRIREARARDSGNTLLVKEYPGGLLVIATIGAVAAAALWRQAGITDPLAEIDAAEIYVPFSWFEPMWLENLGFTLEKFENGTSELHYSPRAEHHNSFAITHGGAVMTLLDVVMAKG